MWLLFSLSIRVFYTDNLGLVIIFTTAMKLRILTHLKYIALTILICVPPLTPFGAVIWDHKTWCSQKLWWCHENGYIKWVTSGKWQKGFILYFQIQDSAQMCIKETTSSIDSKCFKWLQGPVIILDSCPSPPPLLQTQTHAGCQVEDTQPIRMSGRQVQQVCVSVSGCMSSVPGQTLGVLGGGGGASPKECPPGN